MTTRHKQAVFQGFHMAVLFLQQALLDVQRAAALAFTLVLSMPYQS